MEQILAGIEYAHKEGICHLNLKLENILEFNGIAVIDIIGKDKLKQWPSKKTFQCTIGRQKSTKKINLFKIDSYAMELCFAEFIVAKKV